jgi:beta-lactamase regulating signal transducer with metallopeptidase domain/thiol-disulfide isomerase/thioredoxin
MPLVEVLNAWGSAWAAFMLRSLVEATTLLGVLLLVWLPLRRRMSSQLAYGLFLLVLVKATVPIPVTLPAALAPMAPRRVVEQRTVAPEMVAIVAPEPGQVDRPIDPFPALAMEPEGEVGMADAPIPLPSAPSTPAVFMLAWAAVVLGLTVRLAAVHLRMAWRLRALVPIDPATLPTELRRVSTLCGLRREVPLVVTPLVAAPAVWGLVRPRVLFPPGLIEALTPGQLTWVLLHELVHVRRRDGWVVLFQRLVQVVYVFHPAVWIANRFVDIQREFACDDAGLALAGDVSRRDCGAGFLAIVERASIHRTTVTPALGLFGTHIFLRRRLMRILDTRRPLHTRLSARGALLLGVAALVALPDVRAQDEPPRPAATKTPMPVALPAPSAVPTAGSRPDESGPGVTSAQPSPQPVLRIRGQVLDAKTNQPIRVFTLIGGRGPERPGGPPIWYWVGAFKRMMGGQYDESGFFPAHDRGQTHALRVEADGYRSAIVLGIADDAGEFVHDFRLARGGLAGVIRAPDGQPAAGAVVLLSPQDDPSLPIVNGQFHERVLRSSETTTTGPDGQYTFVRNSQPRSMTVLHDTGFAYRSIGEFPSFQEVILEPWGRIEGVIRLGNGPGSGLDVGTSVEPRTFYASGKSGQSVPFRQRYYRSQSKADTDGRFVLDRVQPGPGIVHRVIPMEGGLLLPSHAVHVDVPPGGTIKVALGGNGRPVVGRFISRDGTVPTFRFRDAFALLSNQPPMPTPPDYATYSPERKKQWLARFQYSEEAEAYDRQKQRYTLVLAPDGSFRADDIPPGRYTMTLNLREILVEDGRTTSRTSLKFQRVLDVPEAEPGHEREPFDAGDAILVPKDHRGPEVGQEVPALLARTLDDKPVSLSDHRGKYVLLDFWATWCAPCRAETPHLKAVFKAFGKDEHFVMLGLSVDASVEPLKQYVAENGLGWTQAFLGRGPSEHGTVDFGVHGIPSIWLIGTDGKVVAKGLRGDAIKAAVADALAKTR